MARWFFRRKKGAVPEAAEGQDKLEVRPHTGDPLQAQGDAAYDRVRDAAVQAKQASWRQGLSRLRRVLGAPLDRVLGGRPLNEEVFAQLEETLLSADVGVQTTTDLISRLKERCRHDHLADGSILKEYLKEEILALLQKVPNPLLVGEARPWVMLMVGVNGVGKTTTIAKLAARFCRERKKVLLVAADTFRAAAIEQLEVWAGRLGVSLIKHQSGASPAAVAFDGVRAALARGVDVVIIDTAGRLHTKVPLMEELKKVQRVVARELPGAPHEVLLVLDATTGQNALSQARTFRQALPLTGVILAKMDGSGKGGVVLSVTEQLGLPIRYIGLGEREDDLQDFTATDFVEALFMPGPDISLDSQT